MAIEWIRPLALALLPIAIALALLIDRRYAKARQSRRKPRQAAGPYAWESRVPRPYTARGIKLRIAWIARLMLLCFLCLALAGPTLLLPGNRAATWVVADVSDSAAGLRSQMEAALRDGLAYAPKDLQVGAIAFGQNAMVDAPLAESRETISLRATPDGGGTDIGGALALALALLPEDAAGRIALLSDGQDNAAGVQARLTALSARGIAVDVLPLSAGVARDAQVTSVTPPAQVYQGETFDVVVRLDATIDTSGTLVLYANRQPIATRAVRLRAGENTFIFQDTAAASGVVTYEVQLVAEGDERSQNDRMGAYMDVRGIPKVLVAGEGSELSAMLRAAGMEVEGILASQLPQSAEALRQYHAVALCNVNLDDMQGSSLRALDEYVRVLGRGLLTFGGDDSYALGGWRGSLLEDMLPVTMDVDNRLDMPTLSLVLVIDKSGSMTEGRFGISRMDMAKEAAMRSTEVLTSRDQVGVIAFDDTAKWVVPMQEVTDLGAIQEMIGTIRAGGGTAFYSALSQALEALAQVQTQLRHVIFLTDGQASDSGYEGLVQGMAKQGITVTTVAVGSGANATLLSRLAEMGGGRAYSAGEFDDIPKIFTKETQLATQAYIQNRTFYPVVWAGGTLTNYDGFPPLSGYLTTTARPLATVALATDRDEPVLAWWQYGAGRVLSWTSDSQGAWTGDLLRWGQASEFFAGMVSHVLPAEAGEGELSLARRKDAVTLRYAVPVEETAEDAAGLTTEAIVLLPDGGQRSIPLDAIAPGVYEGTIDAAQQGAYAVRIEQRRDGELARTLETGLTVGYSAEYDLRAAEGQSLLERIAAETGGRLLTDPAELFTQIGAQTRTRRDMTPLLLILCLCVFVLDVAQRRIAWERLLPAAKPKAERDVQRAEDKQAKPPLPESKRRHKKPEAAASPPEADTGEKLLAGRKKKLM